MLVYARKDIGTFIAGRYMITEVITHRDCEVSVYVATDTIAQEEVALKLNTARHRFRCEAEFYDDSIRDLEGFPRMRWAWEHCFCYFTAIALDRLGPSLGALIKEVEESKFSLKTTLQIMNQVITRIQALHERHIIHRGIKPDNFCIGMPGSKTENTVYMIDFDHAKKFRDPLTHLHIPYREENDVGNSSQTSLGVHPWTSLAVDQRVEASRRDDMESAGYMAVLFLKGCLPWCYGRDYCPSYPEHLESKRINVSMEKYDQNADILLREGHQSRISLRRPPRRAQDLHLLLPFSQIRRRARL
ncbi:hypothetical protein, variant 1 [Cryptococcus amylolentus CBS 6039]|uniref:Protein kinase domain-containing protein n=2 Tax=Cryptococcus amylolentus CBS 6039 TaxID=1295533 RepID=A0A1E3HFB3_9TREE|nr:hypothetical protein, variant 1 [Cryptococcus amylolentus CBS 6039]ODN74121.1 hypothetical protein, variant 1 [Cryptococcus amylolentus CBS 6039]